MSTGAGKRIELIGLSNFPMIKAGDDLSACILTALEAEKLQLATGDVLVVAQKIVSKAEGRLVRLADITPSAEALQLSAETGKDPRLAELILRETVDLVRIKPGVAIVEHKLGLVHANAGIDQSNIEHTDSDPHALLLPLDPDGSAARLRQDLAKITGVKPGIIISDSAGRAWRLGTVPIAIGAAGVAALLDQVGDTDLFGRKLEITIMGMGDQIASAAGILMGETDAACPVVLVRGLAVEDDTQNAKALLRPKAEDMFR